MLLSYLSFFTVISSLAFGIFGLLIDPRTKLNRACFLLSLSFAVWAFGNIFFFIAGDKSAVRFWYNISSIGWLSLFVTVPYYFMCLPSLDKLIPSWVKISSCTFLFLYSAVLAVIQFRDTLFAVDFKKTSYGNDEIMNPNLPGYYFTFIMFLIMMIVCAVMVFIEKKYNKTRKYSLPCKRASFCHRIIFYNSICY